MSVLLHNHLCSVLLPHRWIYISALHVVISQTWSECNFTSGWIPGVIDSLYTQVKPEYGSRNVHCMQLFQLCLLHLLCSESSRSCRMLLRSIRLQTPYNGLRYIYPPFLWLPAWVRLDCLQSSISRCGIEKWRSSPKFSTGSCRWSFRC